MSREFEDSFEQATQAFEASKLRQALKATTCFLAPTKTKASNKQFQNLIKQFCITRNYAALQLFAPTMSGFTEKTWDGMRDFLVHDRKGCSILYDAGLLSIDTLQRWKKHFETISVDEGNLITRKESKEEPVPNDECEQKPQSESQEAAIKSCFVKRLRGHTKGITCMTVLTNGKLLTCAADVTMKLWDFTTGKCVRTISGKRGYVTSVAQVSDEKIVVGTVFGEISVRNIETGETAHLFRKPDMLEQIVVVARMSDTEAISTTPDGRIDIWNINNGHCRTSLSGQQKEIISIARISKDYIASGAQDNTICIWNVNTCTSSTIINVDWPLAMMRLSDTSFVACLGDGSLKVWDILPSGDLSLRRAVLRKHRLMAMCVTKISNSCIISGSHDPSLKMWDIDSGKCIYTFPKQENRASRVAKVSDTCIVSADGSDVNVWKIVKTV